MILERSMRVSQSGPRNADCTGTIHKLAVFHIPLPHDRISCKEASPIDFKIV
jgi:hypothetical protein